MVKKALIFHRRANVPEKVKDGISTQTVTVKLGSSNAAALVVGKEVFIAPHIAIHIHAMQLSHIQGRVCFQPPDPANLSCAKQALWLMGTPLHVHTHLAWGGGED